MTYFTDIEQIIQKCIWNNKQPHVAPAISRKKDKVGGNKIPGINQTIFQGTVIKTVWGEIKGRKNGTTLTA